MNPRPLRLRPSAASRWLRCPAFPVLDRWTEEAPTEAQWINEGTAAHYVAERCFKRGEEPESFLGRTINVDVDKGTSFSRIEKAKVDREMVSGVETLLDTVSETLSRFKRLDGVGGAYSEKKLETEFSGFTISGTADFIVVTPRRLAIIDFKYGKNHIVDAVENDQLRIYLLAALGTYFRASKLKCEELLGIIVQPRGVDGPPVKTWIIDDPTTWAIENSNRVDSAVRKIVNQGNDVTFNPSPTACLWCPCIGRCRGLWSLTEMIIHNLDKEVPDLPAEVLRTVLANAKPISDFVKEVGKTATSRALAGEKFDGFKLVEGGRSPWREWRDPTAVFAAVNAKIKSGEVKPDEVFEPLSPAKMEKVLGTEFVDPLTFRAAGDRPTILVPESDRRPPIGRASDEFDQFLETWSIDPATCQPVREEKPISARDRKSVV